MTTDPETAIFPQAVAEFKKIFLDEYAVSLSDKDASENALGILQLFDALTRKESDEVK